MNYIEDHIRKYWKTRTVAMMAEDLNLAPTVVRKAAKKIDIDPVSPRDLKVAFILDNYLHQTIDQLAEALECNRSTITAVMKEYDLDPYMGPQMEIVKPVYSPALKEYLEDTYGEIEGLKRPAPTYQQSGSPYGIAAKNTLP
jgi:hypothetical protein